MKVIVLGSSGRLGQAFVNKEYDNTEVVAKPKFQCNLNKQEDIDSIFKGDNPDIVINCAAFTDVGRAERDRDSCWITNVNGVDHLRYKCRERKVKLVQFSTDYVFSRRPPSKLVGDGHGEGSAVHPLSYYGASKYAMERLFQVDTEHLVIRTGGLYGHYENPKNGPCHDGRDWLTKLLDHLRNGENCIAGRRHVCCTTYIEDLVYATWRLLSYGAGHGLFHVCNDGPSTWHDVAYLAASYLGLDTDKLTAKEYYDEEQRRIRPEYSYLCCAKYAQVTGGKMPHWMEALQRYCEEYRKRYMSSTVTETIVTEQPLDVEF